MTKNMFGFFYLKKNTLNLLFDFSIMFLVCFVHVHLILFYFYLSVVYHKIFWVFHFFYSQKKLQVPVAVDYLSAYFRLFPLISAYFSAYFLGHPKRFPPPAGDSNLRGE